MVGGALGHGVSLRVFTCRLAVWVIREFEMNRGGRLRPPSEVVGMSEAVGFRVAFRTSARPVGAREEKSTVNCLVSDFSIRE
jgi:hypothetical protein